MNKTIKLLLIGKNSFISENLFFFLKKKIKVKKISYEKYKKLKLGEVDGYEIFKFPKGSKDLYGASCELGAGTDWCTATGNTDTWFLDYISKGDIYVIINKSNPKDKYQFHYESDQFMNPDDIDIFDNEEY